MITNEEPAANPTKTYWEQISSGEMSLSTQEIALDFLSQLWWAPEQLVDARNELEEIEAGAEALVTAGSKSLAKTMDTQPEPNATPLELVAHIMEELHREKKRQRTLSEPDMNVPLFFILGAMTQIPVIWKLFTDHSTAAINPLAAIDLDESDSEGPEPATGSGKLSAYQQTVFDFCNKLGLLFFQRGCSIHGFKLRPFPLIAGPTGSGKSHLVRALARAHGCEYFPVTYGSWMVQGSRAEVCTVDAIAAAAAKGKVLVHIDELDKIRSNFDSAWDISIANDIYDLIQQTVSLRNMSFKGDADSKRAKLEAKIRENVWVVGSGTWQQAFEGNHSAIGFAGEAGQDDFTASALERIERLQLVATELIARFNSEIQVLAYPSAQEVAESLSGTPITFDAGQIRELDERIEKHGFRAVENWITDYAIQQLDSNYEQACARQSAMAEVDCRRQEKSTSAYQVTPEEGGATYTVQVKEAKDNQVKLSWIEPRVGKSSEGIVSGFAPVFGMNIWDSFAGKWEVPQRETVSAKTFATWKPRRVQLPATRILNNHPEQLFAFYQGLFQKADSDPTSLDEMVDQIHSEFYTDVQKDAINEDRGRISAAILSGSACCDLGAPDYTGPRINELAQQYTLDVNRGLIELYQQFRDRPKTAELQEHLYQWENRLIDEVLEHLVSEIPICETVAIPACIRHFFNDCPDPAKWENLSDNQEKQFIQACKESEILETA